MTTQRMEESIPHELHIGPRTLTKSVTLPPSKSHTMRALILALHGKHSVIHDYLPSPDTEAMLKAIQQLGAKITRSPQTLKVVGQGLPQNGLIDAGNSGQVLRFGAAMAALSSAAISFTGDQSIRTNRPITPLFSSLEQLGATIEGWSVQGPISPGSATLCGKDSQPVSALLMAASFLKGPTELFVTDPGETPWIDLTLSWMKELGAQITHENYEHYHIKGSFHYEGFEKKIPGDWSSAAFPLIASLIRGESLTICNCDPGDSQGDKKIIPLLETMGAKFIVSGNTLTVIPQNLQGLTIDVSPFIDAVPILAVLGCFTSSPLTLVNAAMARKKESDRLSAISLELKKMGARIEEKEDGLVIYPSALQGARLFSHHDHRIAMALAIAALGSKGDSVIEGASCIAKSYPNFRELYDTIRT